MTTNNGILEQKMIEFFHFFFVFSIGKVWPPKGAASGSDNSQTQSPGPVRRQPKNYQEFFVQNQLPANFPTYRAPPGTQHFGLEEGENTTPM